MSVRRSSIAVAVAAAAVVLGLLTWWVAFRTGVGNRVDLAVVRRLGELQYSRLQVPMDAIASLCNTGPYAALALLVIAAGVVTRGPRDAATIAAVLFGANAITQVLKRVTAEDRVPGPNLQVVEPQSWPSGHATAALALVLCAVVVAPPARRALVAAVGAAFVLALSFSVVALTWHFPSDVVGGYCVATATAALAVAVTGRGTGAVARRAATRARPALGRRLRPAPER